MPNKLYREDETLRERFSGRKAAPQASGTPLSPSHMREHGRLYSPKMRQCKVGMP